VICLDQAVPRRVQDHDAWPQGGLQALQQRRQGPHRPPPATRRGTATGSAMPSQKQSWVRFSDGRAVIDLLQLPDEEPLQVCSSKSKSESSLGFDSGTAGLSSTSSSYPTRNRHRYNSSIPSQKQSWVRFSDGRALIDLLQLPDEEPPQVAQFKVKSNLGFDSATAGRSLTCSSYPTRNRHRSVAQYQVKSNLGFDSATVRSSVSIYKSSGSLVHSLEKPSEFRVFFVSVSYCLPLYGKSKKTCKVELFGINVA
jgi:hypothetical protein